MLKVEGLLFVNEPSMYLDGDNKVSSVLQEVVSVQSNNPRLVRLGNISKYHIYHTWRRTHHYCLDIMLQRIQSDFISDMSPKTASGFFLTVHCLWQQEADLSSDMTIMLVTKFKCELSSILNS